MSQRLPAVTPRDAIRALERAGWYVHRQKGSHIIMHKAGSATLLVVPMHTRDLPKGTLHAILSDAKLTNEEFIALL